MKKGENLLIAQLYLLKNSHPDSSRSAARCLRAYAKNFDIVLPEVCILRAPHGKPYLESKRLFFSISHTEELWGCVVAPCPVGLDLQKTRQVSFASIAGRFFTSKEQQFLATHPEGFFPVWTAKEAYAKWDGRGIGIGLSSFSVADPKGLLPSVNGITLRHFSLSAQEYGCIASQVPVTLQIISLKK